jgi:hypothetical protein
MEPLLSISGELVVFTTSRELKSGTEATSRIHLTQAVWKKKKKNLATKQTTKQNRQEIKKYE